MEPVKFVVLYTDVVMWLIVLLLGLAVRHALRSPSLRAKWRRVADNRTAVACAAVLLAFLVIALADSVHYRSRIGATPQGEPVYATATSSLLDDLVGRHIAGRERSYSVPFAIRDFDKTPVIGEKGAVREFQRLKGVAAGLTDEEAVQKRGRDLALGLGAALAASGAGLALAALLAAGLGKPASWLLGRQNRARPALFVLLGILALSGFLAAVWPGWHVLGTDSTGNDVLMSALKSIRTAVVIGSLATLSALPFAMAFGICAGYFRGWVDDVVQYVYTTISSIPSVLLIAASVLMIQVFIDKNPAAFETGLERADVRLFSLALIIGVTSWAGLARLLRAETMKVRTVRSRHHAPARRAQCRAHRADCGRSGLLRHCALRGGPLVRRRRRRPRDRVLRHDDQRGGLRNEQNACRLVESGGEFSVHVHARALGQPFCRRGSGCL